MARYSIMEIEQMCAGKLYPLFDANAYVSYLMIDSRKLRSASEAIFFAIKGKRQDGHDYIPTLISQGVHNFVVSDESVIAKYSSANFILVKDVVIALQKIAATHRKKFDFPVVAITGSNGKTIVKEWIFQLLAEDYNIVRNPKSFNSQVGVPISIWQMAEENTLGIFEAGISEPDEMIRLEKIIQPSIGVFTNIGEAHAQGFLNIKHKAKEKLKLFINAETLIYCKDHGDVNQAISEVSAFSQSNDREEKINLFTWAQNTDADLRVVSLLQQATTTFIVLEFKNEQVEVDLPFVDKASIENALHCIAVLLVLGKPLKLIPKRVKNLSSVAMRLEMKEAINNCTLINDAYNSDLEAIRIALDFLNQIHSHHKRSVILSDVYQSGKNDPELYDIIAKMMKERSVDRFIGVGKNIIRQRKCFEEAQIREIELFETTDELLQKMTSDWFKNETILLKGSRVFEFERVAKSLERKSHKTVLEINLNAITQNLKAYQSLLKPKTKLMAMVKASAYGAGSVEIAQVLQFNRVDYLAVAYADEGVELRRNGITLPIMVMNPEEASFDAIVNYNLEPEIYSLRLLQSFIAYLHESNALSCSIHIELETGMNRLGFDESSLDEAISILKATDSIKVASVFSHLATSDEPENDDYTNAQISLFKKLADKVTSSFPYPIILHILNSNGIVRFPNAQFDMVRLGLGLYGIDASNVISKQLVSVSSLKTSISQIKKVKKGESIGYSRKGKADNDMLVATIGIGYADGLSRVLSNGVGVVYIQGVEYPILGNICMDMTMIDLKGNEKITEGEEVVIFDHKFPISLIANKIGTIPYEILTSVSNRVKRVYVVE